METVFKEHLTLYTVQENSIRAFISFKFPKGVIVEVKLNRGKNVYIFGYCRQLAPHKAVPPLQISLYPGYVPEPEKMISKRYKHN